MNFKLAAKCSLPYDNVSLPFQSFKICKIVITDNVLSASRVIERCNEVMTKSHKTPYSFRVCDYSSALGQKVSSLE
jgi:hypothetical protein